MNYPRLRRSHERILFTLVRIKLEKLRRETILEEEWVDLKLVEEWMYNLADYE